MNKKFNISKNILYSMYVVENKTTYDIANTFGIHRSTVSNRLREFGIESGRAKQKRDIHKRELSAIQNDFVIGSILGDGHITNGKYPRYSTSHSIKQKEYIEWVKLIFKEYGGKIKQYSTINKKYNKEYEFYNFETIGIPGLQKFRNIFYDSFGKKIIPDNINNILTSPLSLAVWVMEDGTLDKISNRLILCTDCFSRKEHEILQQALFNNFGLDAKIIKYKMGFRLRFGVNETKKISNIVFNYIVDSMRYKIITNKNFT